MRGAECNFVPRNVGRGKVTDFGSFVGYACLLDSRFGQIYYDGGDGMGRVGIHTQYPAEFDPYPNLLASFAQRRPCRALTKVNISARKGPFADLRLNTAPQQKHAAAVNYETSRDQFRAGKIDKPALRANLEPFVIRQNGTDLHRTAAQSTKADILGELMLNTMVSMHRGIIISHCFYRIDGLQNGARRSDGGPGLPRSQIPSRTASATDSAT